MGIVTVIVMVLVPVTDMVTVVGKVQIAVTEMVTVVVPEIGDNF